MKTASPAPAGSVPVWDRLVRATHWLVAAAVLFDLFNDTGPLHRATGYAAAALVVLRLAHGLLFARRGSFARIALPRAGEVNHHLRELLAGRPGRVLGHNPLGQWAANLMWLLILALALSGWLCRLDEFWGEDWPIDLHTALARLLEACVIVHLAGVALMSRLQRENLVAAMLTGRKRP